MTDVYENWRLSVDETVGAGKRIIASSEEFSAACEHIVQLLSDSSVLLANGSHSTATFIAITALEETAKVHMGIFRNSSDPLPRRKDPLYRHHKKHLLALGPTVEMGSRLQKAVGESRMRELVALAHTGNFVDLRESSLYIEQSENGLKVPRNAVSFSTARELLLLAVEAFEDALVGMSGKTYVLSERTDEIFDRWSSV
jgi:AbiV family abortive infection protein